MRLLEITQEVQITQLVLNNKRNRTYLFVWSISLLFQFTLFKVMYPYVNFLPESYTFLGAALTNVDISSEPIGYSKFLRFFSAFTHSDTILAGFQYLFLVVSCMYFFFSWTYFFHTSTLTKTLFFAVLAFNPIFLYLSNCISNDSLYTGLTLIWLTQLMWIIYRPGIKRLLSHALIITLIFSIHENGFLTALVSVIVIFLLHHQIWKKLSVIGIIVLFISGNIRYSYDQYNKLTETTQFSASSGWQIANNALMTYSHSARIAADEMPTRFQSLHILVNQYLDSLERSSVNIDSVLMTSYLSQNWVPLNKYLSSTVFKEQDPIYLKKWASVAPIFSSYGSYLIRKYPITFLKNCLLGNLRSYFLPPSEYLFTYNIGKDTIDPIAQRWFRFTTNKIILPSRTGMSDMRLLTVGKSIIDIIFVSSLVAFIALKLFKKVHPQLYKAIFIFMGWGFFDLCFTIFEPNIVMRSLISKIIFEVAIAFVVFETILKTDESGSTAPSDIGNIRNHFPEVKPEIAL